jgi:hypothetical protein
MYMYYVFETLKPTYILPPCVYFRLSCKNVFNVYICVQLCKISFPLCTAYMYFKNV